MLMTLKVKAGTGRMRLSPDDPRAPKYWMWETSGVLHAVVKAYLEGDEMTVEQVGWMRAYVRQWVSSPVWSGTPELEKLQSDVDEIRTRPDIDAWLSRALQIGIDPL